MSLKKIFNCVAAIGLLSFAVHAAAVSVGEGDWDFCSEQNRCNEGQGDCDFDNECKEGLKCTKDKDVGPEYKYKFDKGVDVCTSSTHNSNNLTPAGNNSTNRGNGGNAFGNNFNNLTPAGNNSTNRGNGGNASGGGCRLTPPTWTYCIACGPCSEGEGWCEKNDECKTGLGLVCDKSTNLCKKPCSNEAPCENGRVCDKGFCQLKGGQP